MHIDRIFSVFINIQILITTSSETLDKIADDPSTTNQFYNTTTQLHSKISDVKKISEHKRIQKYNYSDSEPKKSRQQKYIIEKTSDQNHYNDHSISNSYGTEGCSESPNKALVNHQTAPYFTRKHRFDSSDDVLLTYDAQTVDNSTQGMNFESNSRSTEEDKKSELREITTGSFCKNCLSLRKNIAKTHCSSQTDEHVQDENPQSDKINMSTQTCFREEASKENKTIRPSVIKRIFYSESENNSSPFNNTDSNDDDSQRKKALERESIKTRYPKSVFNQDTGTFIDDGGSNNQTLGLSKPNTSNASSWVKDKNPKEDKFEIQAQQLDTSGTSNISNKVGTRDENSINTSQCSQSRDPSRFHECSLSQTIKEIICHPNASSISRYSNLNYENDNSIDLDENNESAQPQFETHYLQNQDPPTYRQNTEQNIYSRQEEPVLNYRSDSAQGIDRRKSFQPFNDKQEEDSTMTTHHIFRMDKKNCDNFNQSSNQLDPNNTDSSPSYGLIHENEFSSNDLLGPQYDEPALLKKFSLETSRKHKFDLMILNTTTDTSSKAERCIKQSLLKIKNPSEHFKVYPSTQYLKFYILSKNMFPQIQTSKMIMLMPKYYRNARQYNEITLKQDEIREYDHYFILYFSLSFATINCEKSDKQHTSKMRIQFLLPKNESLKAFFKTNFIVQHAGQQIHLRFLGALRQYIRFIPLQVIQNMEEVITRSISISQSLILSSANANLKRAESKKSSRKNLSLKRATEKRSTPTTMSSQPCSNPRSLSIVPTSNITENRASNLVHQNSVFENMPQSGPEKSDSHLASASEHFNPLLQSFLTFQDIRLLYMLRTNSQRMLQPSQQHFPPFHNDEENSDPMPSSSYGRTPFSLDPTSTLTKNDKLKIYPDYSESPVPTNLDTTPSHLHETSAQKEIPQSHNFHERSDNPNQNNCSDQKNTCCSKLSLSDTHINKLNSHYPRESSKTESFQNSDHSDLKLFGSHHTVFQSGPSCSPPNQQLERSHSPTPTLERKEEKYNLNETQPSHYRVRHNETSDSISDDESPGLVICDE